MRSNGNFEDRIIEVFGRRGRVSNSAHGGLKLLAAAGRLLLASPRLAEKSREQENQKNQDAASIQTNSMALPGRLSGVHAKRGRIAGGQHICASHFRSAPQRGRNKKARSFSTHRPPDTFTPLVLQAFLRTRVRAHPEPAFRRCSDFFSAACVPATGRAENPAASSEDDGSPTRNCERWRSAQDCRRRCGSHQPLDGHDANRIDKR